MQETERVRECTRVLCTVDATANKMQNRKETKSIKYFSSLRMFSFPTTTAATVLCSLVFFVSSYFNNFFVILFFLLLCFFYYSFVTHIFSHISFLFSVSDCSLFITQTFGLSIFRIFFFSCSVDYVMCVVCASVNLIFGCCSNL